MNRLYFGDNLKWLSDRKDYPRIQIFTVEGLTNGTERIDAPPQLNPFAMAVRESAREKQTECSDHGIGRHAISERYGKRASRLHYERTRRSQRQGKSVNAQKKSVSVLAAWIRV
jgi:hypothetical protein